METNQIIDDALIPIVIGVTGHRDLRQQDIEGLEQRVKQIFNEIMGKCPNSPILLLSPLAEGADRLIARIALELKAKLVVPLPMPIDEYRKDFKDQASQTEFSELFNKSTRHFELPLVQGNTSHDIAIPGKHRDRQYTHIGAYIAQHSQILIALWDGVVTDTEAGTSAIVRYKLKGIPEPYAKQGGPLTQAESGPVYHVLTPRISNPAPPGQPFALKKIFPEYWGDDAKAESAYDQILFSVDKYNVDVKELGPKLVNRVSDSKRYLIPDEQASTLDPVCQTILNRYALSDVMAQKFKDQRFTTIIGLFSLVVFGFLFFQIYLEFWRKPVMLLLYPLIVGLGFAWYWLAKRNEYENKHEDYRALSEAMRVQFFWKIAGVKENAADHYLHKHKGQLEWIRYAVRVWSIPLCEEHRVKYEHYQLVLNHWVDDQRNYFARRTIQDQSELKKLGIFSNWLFIFGLLVAFCLFVLHALNYIAPQNLEVIYHCMVLVIAMSLASAAAIKGYLEKTALSEQSKQYERMAHLYDLVAGDLSKSLENDDLDGAKNLLLELGREALMENGDWLILHRARPLEVPRIEATLHL